MAKSKKQQNDKLEKPTEDIKVEKPAFKNTLASMIKKKPDDPSSKKKKQ